MVSHEEMAEAFGDEGLLLMDAEQSHEMGLSDEDARILCQIGLPVRADLAFTLLVDDEPRPGSLVVFKTGDGDVDVLMLGGTTGDTAMRYFLDLRSGVVGLLSFDGEPQAERVNGSLATFVEFLYRLRLRQRALNGESADDGRRYTEELWRSLRELDPVAFVGGAEAWWSMVLDNLMDRDLIAETRAFLAQRRAEVADVLSEPSAPAPDDSPSQLPPRDALERALGRLEQEGWQIVDAERFAADKTTSGLLHVADPHFDADGTLVKDLPLSWRGGLPSRVQAVFAKEGLVVAVPGQSDRGEDYDAILEMDPDELAKEADAAMEKLFAAVHGLNEPEEGVVTCLATGRRSDLCRIVRAFDDLATHGYLAEPDLWPTASGGWEHVYESTKAGEPAKAVFWTTQQHTSSFDACGDLVDELALQWTGDRELIARALATTGLAVETPEDDSTAFFLRPVV
ncbi:SUKH-4 immunity protein [Nonomuraea solani]|uniref:SUKH-4 immunity protein n=1 Tax=Nonomuraea solani TaxID=1144553 RepID=A0A1H6E6W2_9ACTN|nr:SUKH-4 family immunity protein [Nonomuraea solani]SEG93001.1 SUKH-4 immunity protein [Nonomuraea solani]